MTAVPMCVPILSQLVINAKLSEFHRDRILLSLFSEWGWKESNATTKLMIVLLDVGNSRFKWALLQGAAQPEVRRYNHEGPNRAHAVFDSFAALRPKRIVVSSVLEHEFHDTLSGLTRREFDVEPEFVQTAHAAHGKTSSRFRPEFS